MNTPRIYKWLFVSVFVYIVTYAWSVSRMASCTRRVIEETESISKQVLSQCNEPVLTLIAYAAFFVALFSLLAIIFITLSKRGVASFHLKPTLAKLIFAAMLIGATYFVPNMDQICSPNAEGELVCENTRLEGDSFGYPRFYGPATTGDVVYQEFSKTKLVVNIVIYYIVSVVVFGLFSRKRGTPKPQEL